MGARTRLEPAVLAIGRPGRGCDRQQQQRRPAVTSIPDPPEFGHEAAAAIAVVAGVFPFRQEYFPQAAFYCLG